MFYKNLEFAIIQVYRERPDLIDAEVLIAIESLIRTYGSQAQGNSPHAPLEVYRNRWHRQSSKK